MCFLSSRLPDASYAAFRTRLKQAGQPIGGNGLLIASHALALECTLVTDNEGEFTRIPDLKRENWLR
jgi:tRNA(fMet)-specific endonuclease VapC